MACLEDASCVQIPRMAIDEQSDFRELADENGRLTRDNRELRRKRDLWVAGLASWSVATVIWCAWTTPLSSSNATDADWSFGNLAMAVLLGAIAYSLLFGWAFIHDQDPSGRKLWAVGSVIPLVLLVAGFALRPEHLVASRSLRAFDTYTGDFPPNALGEPYIADTHENIAWVCAKQIQTRDTHFCTVVWTGEKYRDNFHVAGGFRFHEEDQYDNPSGIPVGQFDCFGSEKDVCG